MAVLPFPRGQSYTPPGEDPSKPGGDIVVQTNDETASSYDEDTGTVQIALPDGDVEISFGPPVLPKKESKNFGDNLAESLTEAERSTIAERLLLGIDQDIQSRSEWMENMSAGISLLALSIKNPKGAAASGTTPAEGISTIDHPLLLEAVLDFQANAVGELLPADGPVKVKNVGRGNALSDELAMALEKDMNYYLTKVAREYYPDTDRMLLQLGFCGISFKKGYHDPIKQRPVIASIDAKDLIVANAATDIDGAGRVTHRIIMRPSVLKRMQMIGAYLDIDLPLPSTPEIKNPIDLKIDQTQGIMPSTYADPEDRERELYECYCEIEVPGFEHEFEGKRTGLPLPYKVTLDKDSRRILEIRRSWDEEDMFCMPLNRIIAYTFIPGLGFYGIGLLNILGNATKAVTAAWRLLIDSGMFSNFPGFLYLKSLGKQLTNQFRIPPGGGMPIDTVGNDIRSSVMALPYQPPNPVFMQLIENIVQTAQRVGGTAQKMIGEGKQDAPVGTTLALIEQAVKLMSAVHKRLHMAQGREFELLKTLLEEDPEALWRHNKKSEVLAYLIAQTGQQSVRDKETDAENQEKALFLTALSDAELIPRADPNTSSQTERYLKAVALRQMAQTNQSLDMNVIDRRVLQIMGIDDAEGLFKPPPPPGAPQPGPEDLTAQATVIAAQARMTDATTKAQDTQVKAQQDQQQSAVDTQLKQQELETKERIANLGVARELVIHDSDQQADQQARQAEQQSKQAETGVDGQQRGLDRMHEMALAGMANRSKSQQSGLDRAHQAVEGVASRQHEAGQGVADRMHEMAMTGVQQQHDAHQGNLDRQVNLATQPTGVAP